MALGSTQPLTEMSTSHISWGVNAAGAYHCEPTAANLTTLCADCLEIWEPQPPGTLRLYLYLTVLGVALKERLNILCVCMRCAHACLCLYLYVCLCVYVYMCL
jgi:hypothetical protein